MYAGSTSNCSRTDCQSPGSSANSVRAGLNFSVKLTTGASAPAAAVSVPPAINRRRESDMGPPSIVDATQWREGRVLRQTDQGDRSGVIPRTARDRLIRRPFEDLRYRRLIERSLA